MTKHWFGGLFITQIMAKIIIYWTNALSQNAVNIINKILNVIKMLYIKSQNI